MMSFHSILGKTTFVSIISSSITYVSFFYFAAFSLNDDYARFSYYQSLMLLLINILPFGTTMAVVIFRYKLPGVDYFELINKKIFILMPIILILVGLFLFIMVFLELIILPYHFLLIILLLCYFNSLTLVVLNYYKVSQLFLKYGCYFIFYTLVNSFLFVSVYFYLEDLTLTFFVICILSIAYSLYNIILFINGNSSSLKNINVYRDIILSVRYGFPVVLSSVTMSFLVVGDKLILGKIAPDLLASYSVASLISSITLFLVNNFASAWGVFLVKQCNGDKREIFSLYKKNMNKIGYVLPLFVMVVIIQYVLYFVIYKDRLPDIFPTVLILTTSYFVFGVSKYFMGYMNYNKKNMAVFTSSLVGVFSIFIILNFYGVNKLAFSILGGMLFQLLFCFLYTNRMLRC
jgi:O-antigen/teichoic acid export membrane protein